MYDMDPRNPWDWTDYVRIWGTVILGILCVLGFIYVMYTYQPDPILCVQCCYP